MMSISSLNAFPIDDAGKGNYHHFQSLPAWRHWKKAFLQDRLGVPRWVCKSFVQEILVMVLLHVGMASWEVDRNSPEE